MPLGIMSSQSIGTSGYDMTAARGICFMAVPKRISINVTLHKNQVASICFLFLANSFLES
jgi:hypothetical protein